MEPKTSKLPPHPFGLAINKSYRFVLPTGTSFVADFLGYNAAGFIVCKDALGKLRMISKYSLVAIEIP